MWHSFGNYRWSKSTKNNDVFMKSIKISHSEGLKEKSHHEVNCSPTVCLGKVFNVCVSCAD